MIELPLDDPRWAGFVAAAPEAGPFHHPAWASFVADTYGFRAFALALVRGGEIAAGFPVVEVRRRLVSLPFTDECAPLASDPDACAQLGLALALAPRRMELRGPLPAAGVQAWDAAVKHALELRRDPGEVRASFDRSRVERNIRRAERESLTVRRATTAADLTETFYRLHLATRRRQGVPVQPRRFFALFWERLVEPGLAHLLIVDADGEPAAAAVFLSFNGTVVYKFGASDPRFLSRRPNHLLFWQAIREACEAGQRRFDFGRTDFENEGLRAFKSGWGTREEPLVYSAVGANASAGPRAPARAIGAVIRRSPLWVCRALGEAFYRYAA